MTRTIRFFCIALFAIGQLLLTQVNSAFAVIANPNPISYTQPDGSKLTILVKGDEFIHWAVTSDGFTIMTNAKGTYEYATKDNSARLVFSGIQANDPEKRDQAEMSWLAKIEKGLFFNEAQIREMKDQLISGGAPDAPLMGGFPPTGTRKLLMILANFSNTTTTYTQANFNNYMNQLNYNGTGSFRDYYIEVSYGQLTVNTTVTVWVTLPNTHDYYGPQSKWGEFAYQAVVAANNQAAVNFADYDNDLDGTVDGVAIIHQGQGQEETGNTLDIWSHSWDLSSAGYSTAQRTFDGVQVEAYTTMPERNASGMGTIGVMCHEFCHNLGSPDFYDTDYATGGSYSGTGKWDLMAGGSWNGTSGTKPAHPNAWTKAFLTWTTPVVITTAQALVLRNAQVYTDVVRYNTTTSNEYFLCENRQQTGFDVGIPGHGLIIYHVDGSYVSSHMWSNDINTTSHQGLYPVCANAAGNPPTVYGTINSSGCPYPGTSSVTSFTDATTPHSHSWAGANTGLPITGITENTTTKEISFCFISCSATGDPLSFTATPFSSSQVNLAWTLNASSNPVLVAYSLTPVFGTPVSGTNYSAGNAIPGGGTVLYNGTNITYPHTGLNSSTTYYYKAWSVLAGVTYSTGIISSATTICGTISSFPWNEGFENGGAIPACWTQQTVTGSLNWTFRAGSQSGIPATTHGGSYNACFYEGSYGTQNVNKLISPPIDIASLSGPQLSFWHTQPYWAPDQDELRVYYKTSSGGSWILLATYTATIPSWTMETLSLPAQSSDYFLAFEGTEKYGYGVCIDDVQVSSSCPTTYPVSVSIAASANPVCQGTSVTFTATPTNGGTTPAYQWKVNGINAGTNSATYSYTPINNDVVTCVLTSNASCITGNPATSNSIIVTAIPTLVVGSISANQAICANTSPLLLSGVAPLNGTSPVYQWQSSLNNNNFSNITGATVLNYQPGSLSETTYYRQLQNATGTCSGPLPTNTVTITVNPVLPVSVSISPSANDICAGTSVTFTPDPVNGGTPSFQWFKNATEVGTGPTYSCIPADGDQVYAVMTSSLACTTGSPATSNTVTMNVNPVLPVSVSISPSANDICAGTSVTFTPDPVNGGTPSYQWFKNATEVGTGATYSCIPADGDQVYAVMTSSLACTTGSPATSNTVTMTVIPVLPVSVSVSPSANDICAGTSVTFTLNPVNGGTPSYQWFKNAEAVGTGSSYSCIPADGDQVYAVMTSSLACTTGSPATSNTVTMTVIPVLPVSVSVSPSANDICAGTSVTFTPDPVNGGTPSFQWFKNATEVGTGATYSCIPADGDQVYAVMTSSLACTTGSPATSNTVTMTVIPVLPVSVSVSPSANDICAGTSVTFTPDPVNGGTPSYQWFKNAEAVGTGSSYSCIPANGDQVYVVMTSSLACTTGSPATSNTVTMTVIPVLPVSVSVTASANPVYAGDIVSFTAIPVNGGTEPLFIWTVNGTHVPEATLETYSYIPADGDVVSCVLISNEPCTQNNPASSNSVVISVITIPTTNVLQDLNITAAQCFDAIQTIMVAGNGTTFTVQPGGSATMIAGESVTYLPGTIVNPGGYMLGTITTTGQYCPLAQPRMVATVTGEEEIASREMNLEMKLYPNPTTGIFTLELTGIERSQEIRVNIYGMRGDKVLSVDVTGEIRCEFSLSDMPFGIYLIQVISGDETVNRRIIKR